MKEIVKKITEQNKNYLNQNDHWLNQNIGRIGLFSFDQGKYRKEKKKSREELNKNMENEARKKAQSNLNSEFSKFNKTNNRNLYMMKLNAMREKAGLKHSYRPQPMYRQKPMYAMPQLMY
jgi:hypothetical protein